MIHASYSLAETIEQMFLLPAALRLGGKSLTLLAEEAGYARHREAINIHRLRQALGERPGLIESWLTYSSEKQADWGWFCERADPGVFLVGRRRHSIEGARHFTDPAEACAHFIKGEFDALLGPPSPRLPSPANQTRG